MNLLLENGLPEEINGIPISPDYRNMIRFDQILQHPEMSESEKLYLGLCQLWPEIPQDIEWAVHKLLWFYSCGHLANEGGKPNKVQPEPLRAYDFDKDSELIYAGFYAAYGISLTTIRFLHWWEFIALLSGLPDTTQMGRIMYYRTVDISQVKDKHQREFLGTQQKRWSLERQRKPLHRTAQELEQATLEKARRRDEEVRRLLKEEKKGR
ncbi:MAG: bacteriophage Gp15 family protein [Muribaculaceae bacterium]|nr:bacteriophage Gp15 family protein [Muribaculaceae bacterium]